MLHLTPISRARAIKLAHIMLILLIPHSSRAEYVSFDSRELEVNAFCNLNVNPKYQFKGPCNYRVSRWVSQDGKSLAIHYVNDRQLELSCPSMYKCEPTRVSNVGFRFEISDTDGGIANITWNEGGEYGGKELGTFIKSGNCYTRKTSKLCITPKAGQK
jgi:hypothetical protein